MKKNKSQQFAKFFIKDLKPKNSKCNNEKFEIDQLNHSSLIN